MTHLGKRRGTLRKLGLRRLPPKFRTPYNYTYRQIHDNPDGSLYRVTEEFDGSMGRETVLSPSLAKLGLQRLANGKVVPIKKI